MLRSPRANLPRAIKVEVTLQSGMDQGLPPIEMTVGLEAKTLASSVKKPGEDMPDGKSLSVTAKVRDVKVTMPNVPQEFSSQLAGLKGGKDAVRYGSSRNSSIIYLGGDVITSIAGVKVATLTDYYSALEAKKPGDIIEITVLRGKQQISLKMTLTERTN